MLGCLLQVGLEPGSGSGEVSLAFLFGGLGLCTVGVGLGFVARHLLHKHWPRYAPSIPVSLGYLLGAVLAHWLGTTVGRAWLLNPGPAPGAADDEVWMLPALLGIAALSGLATTAVAWAWARSHSGALGLGRQGASRAWATGSGVWLLCLPLFYGLAMVWQWVLLHWPGVVPTQAWIGYFEDAGGAPLAVAALLGIVVVPFFEEVLFRGLVQSALVSRMGATSGMILTALLFALLHGVASFVPVLALALVLGEIRQRTGSLWASYAVHLLHNALQIAVLASALTAN